MIGLVIDFKLKKLRWIEQNDISLVYIVVSALDFYTAYTVLKIEQHKIGAVMKIWQGGISCVRTFYMQKPVTGIVVITRFVKL